MTDQREKLWNSFWYSLVLVSYQWFLVLVVILAALDRAFPGFVSLVMSVRFLVAALFIHTLVLIFLRAFPRLETFPPPSKTMRRWKQWLFLVLANAFIITVTYQSTHALGKIGYIVFGFCVVIFLLLSTTLLLDKRHSTEE